MDEELNNVSSPTETGNETDYVEVIQDLKNNTVSKSEYAKLQAENKKLINALANGQTISTEVVNKPDISTLRAKLQSEDQTNLEFITNALALRQAIIDEGGEDPFLPQGTRIAPTPEDRMKAQNVADVFQDCIDYAQGDSQLFTNELQRRTIDVMPMRSKK